MKIIIIITNTSFQFPLILPLTINPLASEILFFSLSNSGLWSIESCSTSPVLKFKIERESPVFAKKSLSKSKYNYS